MYFRFSVKTHYFYIFFFKMITLLPVSELEDFFMIVLNSVSFNIFFA